MRHRDAFGMAEQSGFRGVINGFFGIRLGHVFRRDKDDAAPAAIDHRRAQMTRHAHARHKVDVQRVFPRFLAHRQRIAFVAGDASGMNPDVEICASLGDKVINARFAGQIARDAFDAKLLAERL